MCTNSRLHAHPSIPCGICFFLLSLPFTLVSPHLATDHPSAFNTDAVERAQKYATDMGGGVGSYTNSQGILAVREVRTLY